MRRRASTEGEINRAGERMGGNLREVGRERGCVGAGRESGIESRGRGRLRGNDNMPEN
jgi:hypothetical protein